MMTMQTPKLIIIQFLKVMFFCFVAAVFFGCAGQNFNYSDAKQIRAGMTSDQVVAVMKSKPNVTEVHGLETHFVWAYGDLLGRVKQMRVRFDQTGHVVGTPVLP